MTIYQCIYNEISDRVHNKQYESKEYAELVDVYGVTIHNLEATLTDEQRHLFFEGEAQRNLIAAEDEEQMFQCGFRMGARLMAEILLPWEQKGHP